MTAMIHAVIARDKDKKILQVISCFSEQQIPIAKRSILAEYPEARITIQQSPHEPHD